MSENDRKLLGTAEEDEDTEREKTQNGTVCDKVDSTKPLFTSEEVENVPLLQNNRLSEWDYPIFELAKQEEKFILSKVRICTV